MPSPRFATSASYDAFGKLATDRSGAVNAGMARGFTGHEQLDDIGLVNMDGRIFDPTLGLTDCVCVNWP